jgi:hypothetical protein
MAASAAIVYSGNQGGRADNSGSAPILDTAGDFLPYVMQINARREAERTAEATRAREAAKASEKAWASFEIDMPDVWAADSPYVEQDLVKYHDSLVEEKLKGGDPLDTYSDSGKLRKQNETQIKKRTSLAKDNEAYFTANKEAIAKDAAGKYDKKYAAEWFTKYADPKLTPEDRAKMRLDSSPYKLNYSETAFIDDTLPDPTQAGRKKFIDKGAHLAKMASIISSPEGQDIFNTLKKEGEDETKFMERMAEQAQKMHPPDYGPEPQPSNPTQKQISESMTVYGSGNWKDKFNISAETDDGTDYSQGLNTINISKANTNDNLPIIAVLSDDVYVAPKYNEDGTIARSERKEKGELINFQPVEFKQRKDGGISVKGISDGEEVWVNYDKNEQKFKNQLNGFDVRQEFKARNSGGGKSGGTKYVGLDANGDPIFE